MFEHIINYIAPNSCLHCKREGLLLCKTCQQIAYLPRFLDLPPLEKMEACASYGGNVKALLHALKFERNSSAAVPIATIMAHSRLCGEHIAWVTSVPTATNRVRMRGYDQARLVGKLLAGHIGVPYASLLQRVAQGRQVGSGRQQRRQQIHGVFRPVNQRLQQQVTILLIDDVITTGATMAEAARTLRSAGAGRILGLTLAAA